jgi:hypothetical protein
MRYTFAVCLAAFILGLPVFAHAPTPATPPVPCQAAATGIVTFVEPDGQFYTTLGSADQVYKHAQVQIYRDYQPIAQADILQVNRLDSIGELTSPYRGFRLQTGDTLAVITNPLPSSPRKELPDLEPNPGQRDGETLVALTALLIIEQVIVNH